MKRFFGIGLLALGLVACGDTNPLTSPPPQENPDLPPGTLNPTSNSDVERYEARDDNGSGYAESITYNAGADTFSVDNLPFDADNVYARDDVVPSLGPFRVYENAEVYNDDVTGTPINQLPHKALYGVSTNVNGDGEPVTEFAIVRTGAYVGFGFGGFMYKRSDGVVLPDQGEAGFTGAYAGIRDFQNQGGLEYTTGDMDLAIDFSDFNSGDAVRGTVSNRAIFNVDGVDVTNSVTAALGVASLPTLHLTVTADAIDANGEITGSASSAFVNLGGALETYEEGSYYAVLAGSGADMEVAGIIVVTGEDPRADGVIFRETGGFILYR
ncbi:hypothetical protein [Aliiroseovarius subalbicans]|uniref:hypothetical protein n=1 Tax=Aliiroseovarius subalbicans TaxID=2925840 RepID=UPI001F5795E3|nr:hypothetical protein [Aliiroseovarius subalbicans]MCI2397875.1 hypothetical protein [Aliiroseovarius subalbicans]